MKTRTISGSAMSRYRRPSRSEKEEEGQLRDGSSRRSLEVALEKMSQEGKCTEEDKVRVWSQSFHVRKSSLRFENRKVCMSGYISR